MPPGGPNALTRARRYPRRRYDPYAAESSGGGTSAAAAEDGNNAYENMKGLLALARMKSGGKGEEQRGGWQGAGKLRGIGKDYGMVTEQDDPSAMPDSTDSEDSDDESESSGERVAPIATSSTPAASAAALTLMSQSIRR